MKKTKLLKTTAALATITLLTVSTAMAAIYSSNWDDHDTNLDPLSTIKEDTDNLFNLNVDCINNEYMSLNWDVPSTLANKEKAPYEYTVYAREKNDASAKYKPISVDGQIKVLNIYPGVYKKIHDEVSTDVLERWMNEPAAEVVPNQDTDVYNFKNNDDNLKYRYIEDNGNFIAINKAHIRKPTEPDRVIDTPQERINVNFKTNKNGQYTLKSDSPMNVTLKDEPVIEKVPNQSTDTYNFVKDGLKYRYMKISGEYITTNGNHLVVESEVHDSQNKYLVNVTFKKNGDNYVLTSDSDIKPLDLYFNINYKGENAPMVQIVPDQTKDDYNFEQSYLKFRYVKNGDNYVTKDMKPLEVENTDTHVQIQRTYIFDTENNLTKLIDEPLITVNTIDLDKFESELKNNNNPLLDENNNYKYDVIVFGCCDCNNGKCPTDDCVDELGKFIDSGRGILAGHDTIGYTWGTERGLGRLRQKFMIKVSDGILKNTKGTLGDFKGVSCATHGNRIKVQKKGSLTNYPWHVALNSTSLIVPASHSTNNFAYGDIWMTFDNSRLIYEVDKNNKHDDLSESDINASNYYLTTYKNTAMIQTGNLVGHATQDEERLFANTIFYLHQLTASRSITDHNCQDKAAPDTPAITDFDVKTSNTEKEFTVNFKSVKDNGTAYQYVVKAHNISASKAEDEFIKSKEGEGTITTGVKGYLICTDNKEDTDINNLFDENNCNSLNLTKENLDKIDVKFLADSSAENFDLKEDIGDFKDNFYVHIAAIDNAGNISDTATKKYEYCKVVDAESNTDKINNGHEEWVNIVLKNVKGNKTLQVNEVSDITSQKITIKYDPEKLIYNGACTCNKNFRILSTDNNNGTITFNLRCKYPNSESDNLGNSIDMLSLAFERKTEGESVVKVYDAQLNSVNDKIDKLLPVQRGEWSFK